jgi:carboxypeptidase Taq
LLKEPLQVNFSSFLDSLKSKLTEIHHLRDAAAVLSWDQETYMPAGGGQARAEQIATLQTIAHDKFVSAETEELLNIWIDEATGQISTDVQSDLDDTTQALLRETWQDFSRAKKLPSSFVNQLQRECSLAQQMWAEARKNNDFKSFLPNLRTLLSLKIEEAQYLGFVQSPYDPLLDKYEPGATAAQLKPLFAELRERLVSILQKVLNSSHKPNEALLTQAFETKKQLEFGRMVLEKMGYLFDRGRLDLSTHPFTTSFHPTDVRVTTRVFEHDLSSCLFSCIHEGGHGLYEQGLLPKYYGTPLAEPVSLGIHESQSRLWENCVGRSEPFWQHFYPLLQKTFPSQLREVLFDDFYPAINMVKPSLIRVEADELTYNLHIMVRFEIELALIEGQLQVEELPTAWNDKMQDYLGIKPDRDAEGVLQDVHWSMGAFGYFPTYALGNLYASMLYDQALQDIPGLEEGIARGSLLPLRDWLNENIHQYARQFTSKEIVQRVTGHSLSTEPFLHYLERKFGKLYGFSQRG